jgi:hypothetical protein
MKVTYNVRKAYGIYLQAQALRLQVAQIELQLDLEFRKTELGLDPEDLGLLWEARAELLGELKTIEHLGVQCYYAHYEGRY